MNPAQTIVACASGWGHSARALIRISGPDAPSIAAAAGRPEWQRGVREGRLLVPAQNLGTVPGELPCLLLCFPGPASYTGEDLLELLIPGNPLLIERIIAMLCSRPNLREARPGEFSARAFLNGRLGLAQAEGVASIIAAGTDDQLQGARAVLDGSAGRRYAHWADHLATLLALVEAGIDFTDQEDVVPIAPDVLSARLKEIEHQIVAHLGSRAGQEPESLRPRAVLAGRPNAGKSTLFNALLSSRHSRRRMRAVESPFAGTTRDCLVEELDLSAEVPGGIVVDLVDLAGLDLHPATSGSDAQAQARARDQIAVADVVIHCDPSGRFQPLPPPSHARVRTVIRVRTKADLPASPSADSASEPPIAVCALDGWNLPVLRRAIADAAWTGGRTGGEFLLPRHRRTLAAAAERLSLALALVNPAGHHLTRPEVIAGELRSALDLLGELTGAISPDDIVGRIFATFCIGK